ncbi:hypothetical protein SAMN05428949_1380 [Chitinophaga sp. YR627]|nr:hypothetical protein SAMN05428949_1380 [Chitinophaga sp. YR627]
MLLNLPDIATRFEGLTYAEMDIFSDNFQWQDF